MLECTDAWRLLLYFVDDLVAVGRGEAIDTMAYSAIWAFILFLLLLVLVRSDK